LDSLILSPLVIVHLQLYCHPCSISYIPCHNRRIYHIPGKTNPFLIDKKPCHALSFIVFHLFPSRNTNFKLVTPKILHDHWKLLNNRQANNCPDIISECSLFTKLYDMLAYFLINSYLSSDWFYCSYMDKCCSTY